MPYPKLRYQCITGSRYKRNGLDCFLCACRRKLIISTPEEAVRQAFITYLTADLGVPSELIEAEVPMSYYEKAQSGRADIVVSDATGNARLLVECKAASIFLSDAAVQQAQRYNAVIKARIIVITNSVVTYAFESTADGELLPLAHLVPYSELIGDDPLPHQLPEPWSYDRLDVSKPIPDAVIAHSIQQGYIGEDTSPALYPLIFNLMDWMFDADDRVEPQSLDHISLVEDCGIRSAEFGNAGGGTIGMDYRYFLISDSKLDNQIVSLTIAGIAKTVDDPHWKNRTAGTILAVAIDDFQRSHMSLELRLDKYVSLEANKAIIWHDGTLTVGKLGSVRRQLLLDYIFERAPHLSDDHGALVLGELDLTQEIRSQQAALLTFLDNLLLYAVLRDEFRDILRSSLR
ncbi:type I restriction enzyme HsdR N-terminal domain-containing protein [Hymenobacter canadensis]|uniref:Type I restriction enzyme HsdR N-terminal domain-containing protein n=1 Tax=Hymenobacter canadensis TaxID=2999067 RepID=A0ABY7LWJ7_9BACT|nr:type I restriction enzyme HsdR N-terminal domain-containing protein [Hymenobacter canadensis]WBA44292.1 type I restriction enzyme HsdR N-terminal domain-containing protein [Hymenobacter canadensis]